jgi:8-oxo-dGTP pyrophosphatase MutT (NUDIX family)
MSIVAIQKPRFHDLKLRWEGDLSDPSAVISYIEARLAEWTAANSPSIWLKLSGPNLRHLTFFLAHGFAMHRVKGGTTLVLNRWIRPGAVNLPPGPFGYIGCGALVVDDAGRVLAIRENYYEGPGPWKLPGGLFDCAKDRDIGAGAVRECFEETGVRAEFLFIAVERFTPVSVMFHHNDLYAICRCRPVTTDIHIDSVEIAECRWVTKEEFLDGVLPAARAFLEPAIRASAGLVSEEAGSVTVYRPTRATK